MFEGAIDIWALIEAKMWALMANNLIWANLIAVGGAAGVYFSRMGGRVFSKFFQADSKGYLFNLEEAVGFLMIIFVVNSFPLLSSGYISLVQETNSMTQPTGDVYNRMQENSIKILDQKLKDSQSTQMAKAYDKHQSMLNKKLAAEEAGYDALVVVYGVQQEVYANDVVKYQQLQKDLAQAEANGESNVYYEQFEQEAAADQLADVREAQQAIDNASMLDAFSGDAFERAFQEFFHWLCSGLASIIKSVCSDISAVAFAAMMTFGPIAFALSTMLKGLYMTWLKYTLTLGLVNSVFNVLEHFMDVSLTVLQYSENSGSTWEILRFDIVMIAMFIMAFKISGKIAGDGGAGMIASKSIGVASTMGAAAIGGAVMAGKGFSGIGDMAKQVRNNRRQKYREPVKD